MYDDLRFRFAVIVAAATFPILVFALYVAFSAGRFILIAQAILAWMFAFATIWIAVDKLVFRHLRKIEKSTLMFAQGDLDARVVDLANAPKQVEALALAFNEMADTIQLREAEMLDNISEKEALLREIHHRVKNNLQIIISLLNMQERKIKGEEAGNAIRNTRDRINAIALVHRGLYEGDDVRLIDLNTYLDRLITSLFRSANTAAAPIEVQLDLEDPFLEPDKTIPLSLFIIEAVSNALKFGVEGNGEIKIELNDSANEVSVHVRDSGISGDETPIVEGTGYKLMRGFARQLDGRFSSAPAGQGQLVGVTFSRT